MINSAEAQLNPARDISGVWQGTIQGSWTQTGLDSDGNQIRQICQGSANFQMGILSDSSGNLITGPLYLYNNNFQLTTNTPGDPMLCNALFFAGGPVIVSDSSFSIKDPENFIASGSFTTTFIRGTLSGTYAPPSGDTLHMDLTFTGTKPLTPSNQTPTTPCPIGQTWNSNDNQCEISTLTVVSGIVSATSIGIGIASKLHGRGPKPNIPSQKQKSVSSSAPIDLYKPVQILETVDTGHPIITEKPAVQEDKYHAEKLQQAKNAYQDAQKDIAHAWGDIIDLIPGADDVRAADELLTGKDLYTNDNLNSDQRLEQAFKLGVDATFAVLKPEEEAGKILFKYIHSVDNPMLKLNMINSWDPYIFKGMTWVEHQGLKNISETILKSPFQIPFHVDSPVMNNLDPSKLGWGT